MTTFRERLAGLQAMPPVVVDGHEYTGEYLAMYVSINAEDTEGESARTPQLISELGRLTARARREWEWAKVRFNAWRAEYVHELTTDRDAAENAGLLGTYAKGGDKMPSKDTIETYTRTLPEYQEYKAIILDAQEAYESLYAAFEAAQARKSTIWGSHRSGGADTPRRITTEDPPPDGNDWDASALDYEEPLTIDEAETSAVRAPRTPIPSASAPPPPPPPAGRPVPPPPPAPPGAGGD